jgi:hypothetical protein
MHQIQEGKEKYNSRTHGCGYADIGGFTFSLINCDLQSPTFVKSTRG